jgi:hypothetical protein
VSVHELRKSQIVEIGVLGAKEPVNKVPIKAPITPRASDDVHSGRYGVFGSLDGLR